VKTVLVLVAAVAAALMVAVVLLGRDTKKEGSRAAEAVTSIPDAAAEQAAVANVQTAIAALATFHSLNETYAGATVTGARLVRADATSYCIESTVRGATESSRGPNGAVVAGPC